MVDRASVIGRVFWDRAVERLGTDAAPAIGADEGGPDAYQRLRAREVVHQRPTSTFERTREFSFRHALLRDVAYDGLLRPRRRRYHSLAARWMQEAVEGTGRAEEHAGTIAHHLLEAGEDAAAARWLLLAGRHAARAYAGDQALDLLEQAERLAPDDDPGLRFDVLIEQEQVLDRTGARDAQREVLDRLLDTAGDDPERRAHALVAQGRWLFFHSDYAATVPVAQEATVLAVQVGRADLELQALLLTGRALAFRGDHAAAREHLGRLLARAQEVGSLREVAETQRLLGVVATNLHEQQVAAEALLASAATYRDAADLEGEALATGQLAALHLLTGQLEQARRASEEALAIFVTTGHRLRQGIVLGNLVSIAMEQGRLADALRLGEQTLALTEELEDAEGVVSTLLRLGEVARLAGDVAVRTRRGSSARSTSARSTSCTTSSRTRCSRSPCSRWTRTTCRRRDRRPTRPRPRPAAARCRQPPPVPPSSTAWCAVPRATRRPPPRRSGQRRTRTATSTSPPTCGSAVPAWPGRCWTPVASRRPPTSRARWSGPWSPASTPAAASSRGVPCWSAAGCSRRWATRSPRR